jgi:hypothetical protein
MSDKKIIKLEFCDLTDLWEREDSNFTPWLKNNIEFLNDILPFEIEITTFEKPTQDKFRADLYGKTNDGKIVIIENQYKKSDHKHLGQLLVYTLSLNASIGIWICEEARQSHIEVIEWLNENSPADKGFYLIKLKLGKVEDTYIPIFKIIVQPSKEAKNIGDAKKEFSEAQVLNNEFWTEFLRKSHIKTEIYAQRDPEKNYAGNELYVSGRFSIRGINISPKIVRQEVHNRIVIETDDEVKNKEIFDDLFSSKEEIEKDLRAQNNGKYTFEIEWHRMDIKRRSIVQLLIENCDKHQKENWDSIHNFLIDSSIWLKSTFGKYIQD